MKTAGKGASTHQGEICQRVQRMGLCQMGTQVVEQLVHPDIAGGGGHRLLDKLGLTPSRWGGITSRRATLLAMAEPWYWRTR